MRLSPALKLMGVPVLFECTKQEAALAMGTNEGWPEAFGFSVSGDGPVLISAVEKDGSAQQAGLQTGDVIVELDGVNVEHWTKEEVIDRARCSTKVPPSLVVMSRVRKFDLPRGPEGGFGITLQGNCPVFIRSVDFHSPARAAGVKSGDLLLEVNGDSVRFCSKLEVLELLKRTGRVLQLTVIAGGLCSTPLPPPHPPQGKAEMRYQKAKVFHSKVNYYLLDDDTKKSHLLTLLRLYARDRDINTLGSSLDVLLETPIERRLLADIRTFIHPQHHARFDTLVSFTSTTTSNSTRRGASHDMPRPLSSMGRYRSSMPNLATVGTRTERYVHVDRGHGGFGFTLSGNAPVFIRSVDAQGAAARAGLQAGDQIMELNGLNVRNATHSHVVRLLKGSGTRPFLLVSSSQGRGGGRRSSTTSLMSSSLGGGGRRVSTSSLMSTSSIRENSTAFKEKMEQVLLQGERQQVIQQLGQFSQDKDLPSLVQGLGKVLDDPNKMVLFHYICQLLPEEAQTEFDRVAATMLTGGPDVVKSSSASEPMGDLLYRVQSGRLPAEVPVSSRHVATHHFQPAGGGGAGMVGGAVVQLQDTAIGETFALMDTPIRHVGRPSQEEGPPEGGEDLQGRETLSADERKVLRVKRESLEKTPVGQDLTEMLGGRTPRRRPSKEPQNQGMATPNAAAHNISSTSTPGTIPLPPNPPPTPRGGVGGVPIPPPPPPCLPGTTGTQSRLKRVNWEKIHNTEGTIWSELSGLEDALEYCELDKQFATQKTKDAGKVQKSKHPSVLEPKKSYNIAILLGHLKLPFERIREAILACDDTVLSEQHLRQLETFAPNKKECLGFARYYDNPSVLSLPDRFSCEMSTIPYYRERLRAMIFRMHFSEKVNEIKPDLEAISLASVQLQTSKSFKRVLEIVLAMGNHMNAGNIRVGGAVGFRITFLTQLKALRTSDNRSSLLQFLAETVERKFPQALEFTTDLSYTSRAARVSGQTLEVELNELTQGLTNIRRDICEMGSREKLPGDLFEEIMTSFLTVAETHMAELLRLHSRMKQEYQKVVKFFGEDPGRMRIDDFFGTFTAFISDFEQAVQDNKHAREEQVLKEKKAREREELARKRGSQKTSSRVMTSSSEEQVDLRGELEAWQSRSIDVSSLERPKRRSPEQKDFRHILRQPDHSRKERGRTTTEERQRNNTEERRKEKVDRQSEVERGREERGQEKMERGRGTKEWREMGRGKKAVRVERPQWSRTTDNRSLNGLDFDSETQF